MPIRSHTRSIATRRALLAGIACAAIAAAFAPFVASAQADAKTMPFRVSILKGNALSYLPIVAQETGIWAKHGVGVEFVNVTNGPTFISSVQSGSADGGVSAFTLTVPAHQKGGKKLVAIAGDVGKASYTIAVRPGLEDKVKGDWRQVAQSLKGMKFGVPAVGGEVDYVFRGLMQAAGVDPARDMTVVQAGAINAAIAALRRGDIDAYIGSVYAQVLGIEEKGIAKIVLDLNTAEPFRTWTHTQFFVAEDLVRQRPELARRIQAALRDTHAWLKDPNNFERAHRIANGIFPVSEPALKDMISRYRYELPRDAVQANLSLFEKAGIIKQPVGYDEVVWQPGGAS